MWPSSESQIDKPQRGRPKRVELPDVNINTGAQSFFYQGCGGAANLVFSGLYVRFDIAFSKHSFKNKFTIKKFSKTMKDS